MTYWERQLDMEGETDGHDDNSINVICRNFD